MSLKYRTIWNSKKLQNSFSYWTITEMFVILEPEYGTDDTSLFVETTEYRMGKDYYFLEYSKLVQFP